jgi:hypothetical protein
LKEFITIVKNVFIFYHYYYDRNYVVFQTIKLGDSGKVINVPPATYFSELQNYTGIPLADVMPFHIAGGHITTNLYHKDFKLLALRLDGKKQSIPIIIDFQESITEPSIYSFFTLNYIILNPKMHGYYFGAGSDGPHKVDYDLEDITHLYLISTGGEVNFSKVTNAHSVTMTLIISREPARKNNNIPTIEAS